MLAALDAPHELGQRHVLRRSSALVRAFELVALAILFLLLTSKVTDESAGNGGRVCLRIRFCFGDPFFARGTFRIDMLHE